MPLSQINRKLFHWALDRVVPNNCRRQLKKASEDNLATCDRLIYLLQVNRKPLVKAFKSGN